MTMDSKHIQSRSKTAGAHIKNRFQSYSAWYRMQIELFDFHEAGVFKGTQIRTAIDTRLDKNKEVELFTNPKADEIERSFHENLEAFLLASWVCNPCAVNIEDSILSDWDWSKKFDLENLIGCSFYYPFPKPQDYLGFSDVEGFLLWIVPTTKNKFVALYLVTDKGENGEFIFVEVSEQLKLAQHSYKNHSLVDVVKIAAVLSSDYPQVKSWRSNHLQRAYLLMRKKQRFAFVAPDREVVCTQIAGEKLFERQMEYFIPEQKIIYEFSLADLCVPDRNKQIRINKELIDRCCGAINFLKNSLESERYGVWYRKFVFSFLRVTCSDILEELEKLLEKEEPVISEFLLQRILLCLARSTCGVGNGLGDYVPDEVRKTYQLMTSFYKCQINKDKERIIEKFTGDLLLNYMYYLYRVEWHKRNNLSRLRENTFAVPNFQGVATLNLFKIISPILFELANTNTVRSRKCFHDILNITSLMEARLAEQHCISYIDLWKLYCLLKAARELVCTKEICDMFLSFSNELFILYDSGSEEDASRSLHKLETKVQDYLEILGLSQALINDIDISRERYDSYHRTSYSIVTNPFNHSGL